MAFSMPDGLAICCLGTNGDATYEDVVEQPTVQSTEVLLTSMPSLRRVQTEDPSPPGSPRDDVAVLCEADDAGDGGRRLSSKQVVKMEEGEEATNRPALSAAAAAVMGTEAMLDKSMSRIVAVRTALQRAAREPPEEVLCSRCQAHTRTEHEEMDIHVPEPSTPPVAAPASAERKNFTARWKEFLGSGNAAAVFCWSFCCSTSTGSNIVAGEYSPLLKAGACSPETIVLVAALFQLGDASFRCLLTLVRLRRRLEPQQRSWGAARRALGFNARLALKHSVCGVWGIMSDLLGFVAINYSTPVFASTIRLVGAIMLTVTLRYLILGRRASGLQILLLLALLLMSVGFIGFQSSRMDSSQMQAVPALLAGGAGALASALNAVYSEAVFAPPPATAADQEGPKPVPMAQALGQTMNNCGAVLASAVWNLIRFSLTANAFEPRIWSPWGWPGPIVTVLCALSNVGRVFTLEFCGALPFSLISVARLALVYCIKVAFLHGFFSLWELMICVAVVATCAYYMLAADLINPSARKEVGNQVLAIETKVAQKGAAAAKAARSSMAGLPANFRVSTTALTSRVSGSVHWRG